MPRLSRDELSQIIRKGFLNLKIALTDEVLDKIVQLSHGLPHYTHMLAYEAGRAAIERGSYLIENADLVAALDEVVNRSTASPTSIKPRSTAPSGPANTI